MRGLRDDSWNDSGILNTETERTRHWRKTAQAADNATTETDKSQHDYNYDCTFTLNDRADNECAHCPASPLGTPNPKNRPHCRIFLCIIHGKLECIIPHSHQKNSNPNH